MLLIATSVFFVTGTSIDDASAVDRAGTTGCWVVGATLTETLEGTASPSVPIAHALVTDNSGKYIYAGTFTTGLLISKTGGRTWSRVTEISATARVDGVATDSTGKYVYATVNTSDVMFVSSNYGESFIAVDPSPGVTVNSLGHGGYASGVATDSTGQYVYVSAGLGSEYFYKSINWGVSFNKVLTTGKKITALATGGTGSSAGKYLLSGAFDSGSDYYTSNNSGTSWTTTPMSSGQWNGVAMSSDGRVQVITNAITSTGGTSGLRISTNFGASFTAKTNFLTAAGNPTTPIYTAVTNVAMSADGSVILAGSEGTGIGGWISTDTGTSFTPIATLTGSYAGNQMRSSALSGDGTKVYSIFEGTNKFVTLIKNPILESITATYLMGLVTGSVASTNNPNGQCGTGLVLAQPSSKSAVIDGFDSTFLGWKDPSGNLWQPGVAYAGALAGDNTVALTAAWSTPPRTISYNNNGTYNGGTTTGTSPIDQYYTSGESTLTLATDSGSLRLGAAVLTGWNTAANGSGTSYTLGQTGVSVETNTTLYAQWAAPITYNVNKGVGSQASETYTVRTGSVTLPETSTFTYLGHSFGGWSDTTTSTTPITTYSTLSAVNLYAIWTRNEYAATFYKNSETATGTMAVESKTAATVLTANSFLLANKVFNEWNTAADGSGTRIPDRYTYPFLASISLYAQWGNVITYSTLGADSGTPYKLSETWTAGVTNLSSVGTMKKAGYSLGGWSDGTTTYTTTYTPTTGITLNPVWTPNTYTVSFNKNGVTSGTLPSDQTWIESTTALTLSGNTGTLVKDGNTWGGWASTSSGQSAMTTFSSTSDTSTVTLYAIWNKVSYSVTYALNGGTSTLPTEISHTINETFTVAATPTKDTFIFGGWSDGKTTTSAGNSYSVESSTVTLTAQWIATYEVSYLMNGSLTTPVSNTIYTVDSITATASAPTRTGYTFDHWKDSNGDTYTAGSNFKVIRDSALKAQWTAVAYTVTYSLNSGTSSLPTQANVNITNSFTIAPTMPTRAGYRFTGWSDGTNTYGEGATYTVGSANITLTAQWTAINYTVTYELGGGTGTRPSHAAVNIGDTFTVSTEVDPTWLAHTFAGWSDGSSDYAKSATYTTSSSNITLTAKWTQNDYTQITYALGGGSGTLPTQPALLEGSTFIVASGAALTKSGEAFAGWSFATITFQFNDVYDVGSDAVPVILTAQWATGYSVTYSAESATGTVPTDTVLRLTSATFTLSSGSTLSKTGYTFAGWNDGAGTYSGGTSRVIGSAHLIFTAQWTLIIVAPAPTVSAPTVSNPIVITKIEPVVIPKIQITPDTGLTSPVVAAQIALIQDQSNAQSFFAALPPVSKNVATKASSNPTTRQIKLVGELTSINTQSATTNSSEIANFKLPATNVVLSDLVVTILEEKVKLVSTVSGFSVTPVSGFTGVLVIPVVATIDGVQITVLNRVVVNPVAPVAIGFTPKSVKESAISWTPSASQVVAYVVEVNGKTLCQTSSSSCPVPALIGPNSKVTISAVGNDQTSSAPEVIPYVAKAPIPALSVAFALNSSRLSNAQKTELRKVAKIIEREGFTRLVVSGFTDAQGSVAANKVLSAARAKATAAFLTQLLPDITVKSSAYGAKKPVRTGKSITAYEANRRSEISVW